MIVGTKIPLTETIRYWAVQFARHMHTAQAVKLGSHTITSVDYVIEWYPAPSAKTQNGT